MRAAVNSELQAFPRLVRSAGGVEYTVQHSQYVDPSYMYMFAATFSSSVVKDTKTCTVARLQQQPNRLDHRTLTGSALRLDLRFYNYVHFVVGYGSIPDGRLRSVYCSKHLWYPWLLSSSD